MQKIAANIIFVACLSMGTASAVQPQNGFWAIDDELNGQPGRGFQVDTQGDVLVFSYYGYRTDGSATFYLSSGQYENGAYTGTLFEYKGGTPVGQPFRNGTEAGSPGVFNIRFTDSTRGFLTLPGEPRKAISRFTFYDAAPAFANKTFKGSTYGTGSFNEDSTKFSFSVSNGSFSLRRDAFFSGACLFDGTYSTHGLELESSGTYRCADFSEGIYSAKNLSVDANGFYRGVFYKTPAKSTATLVEYHSGK